MLLHPSRFHVVNRGEHLIDDNTSYSYIQHQFGPLWHRSNYVYLMEKGDITTAIRLQSMFKMPWCNTGITA